jgi:hypothetical protein
LELEAAGRIRHRYGNGVQHGHARTPGRIATNCVGRRVDQDTVPWRQGDDGVGAAARTGPRAKVRRGQRHRAGRRPRTTSPTTSWRASWAGPPRTITAHDQNELGFCLFSFSLQRCHRNILHSERRHAPANGRDGLRNPSPLGSCTERGRIKFGKRFAQLLKVFTTARLPLNSITSRANRLRRLRQRWFVVVSPPTKT